MNAPLKQPTINDVISDCFKKTGDREKAADMAISLIYMDKALYKVVCDELLHLAVRDLVNKECANYRAAAWVQTQRDRANELSGIAQRAIEMALSGERKLLMEMPLSKGRLGDYTGPMLDDEATMYERNARTLATRAFWLRSIRFALPTDEVPVRQVFDEQALAALQLKAGAE